MPADSGIGLHDPDELSGFAAPGAPGGELLLQCDADQPGADESDARSRQRMKQVCIGKSTVGYLRYLSCVPKAQRVAGLHLSTPSTSPRHNAAMSKREFEKELRMWRKFLHTYDEVEESGECPWLASMLSGQMLGRPVPSWHPGAAGLGEMPGCADPPDGAPRPGCDMMRAAGVPPPHGVPTCTVGVPTGAGARGLRGPLPRPAPRLPGTRRLGGLLDATAPPFIPRSAEDYAMQHTPPSYPPTVDRLGDPALGRGGWAPPPVYSAFPPHPIVPDGVDCGVPPPLPPGGVFGSEAPSPGLAAAFAAARSAGLAAATAGGRGAVEELLGAPALPPAPRHSAAAADSSSPPPLCGASGGSPPNGRESFGARRTSSSGGTGSTDGASPEPPALVDHTSPPIPRNNELYSDVAPDADAAAEGGGAEKEGGGGRSPPLLFGAEEAEDLLPKGLLVG